MGFFSELLGVVAPIAGAFLGVPQAPAAVAPTALVPAPLALAATPTPAGLAVLAAKGGGGTISLEEARRAAQTGVLGAPSGRMRKRTIVETFDPVTQKIFKIQRFAGGVAVRSSDVAAARRVFRQIRKLDSKLPRKTVKQSAVKQLTDRVIKNALEHAGDPHNNGECPK